MSCLPNKSHITLRCQTIPPFPSWLSDEGRSLHLMMGREFVLHLYLESPVFFQIQPGNLEQPVGTDKCSIARACTLGPSSRVFMLFIQLFIDVFKRWKQSLSPPTFHPRKPSRELAAYSGQGQEKPSTSYVPFWIRPLRLPFSWSFGGSFE